MADNKLLLKRDSDEDFLAEDDPLAELARIVGFEPAPVAKPAPIPRREPVFDLEDELLKELEIYSRSSAPEVVATPEAAPAPVPEVAPVIEPEAVVESEPVFESDPGVDVVPEPEIVAARALTDEPAAPARAPVVLEAVETFVEAGEGRVYERPASHPVFDLEDEILREFAAFDARTVVPQAEQTVEAEIVHQDVTSLTEIPVELHDVPERQASFSGDHAGGRDVFDSFFDDDLDAAISDAVESAIDEPSEGLLDPSPALDAVEHIPVDQSEERAPLIQGDVDDGYWAKPTETVGEPAVEAPSLAGLTSFATPEIFQSDLAFAEEAPVEIVAEQWTGYDRYDTPVFVDEAAPAEDARATDLSASAIATYPPANDYGLDELLAEVERYPVADSSGRWGVQSKAAEPDEIVRMSAPVVQDFAPEPAFVEAPVESAVASASMEPVAAATVDMPSDEALPDIDIGAIAMELSELQEDDFAVSPDLLSAIGDAVVSEDEPEVAPPARLSEGSVVDGDYSTLPFDPTQIVQEEETLETIADMDVPDIEVVHEEERPSAHPEYDIDLDAEMAQLFVTATAPAVSSQRSGRSPDNVVTFDAVPPPKPQSGSIDLDEFERALEEDFRRSFSENRATSNPDRVALAPAAMAPARARSNRNAFLLAGAAVLIAVFGGAGVFAFMSGDTPILVSSEPKVILADTDPVKVVPDDPGGKEVPNQNKAVYDRVSGTKVDETKQESLVTSNEEPIDVVQRTLEPENLPMDDDAMAMATPTDDTADPRLLPDQGEQERVTTTSKVLSGVSPRKVKTMVVRPDGTLVEREVTEDDVKQQAANDAELMKIAQKAAQDAAIASDSQADDIAKTIESVPERLAPSNDSAATPVETKEVETEQVATEPEPVQVETKPVNDPAETVKAETKPVNDPVETVKAEPETPVVTEEPVKAVETSDLRPVEATVAEEKPVDRSLAAEDKQAVSDESAAKLAEAEVEDAPVRKVKTTKITPVPEVRPIDQPVTVVGTVSDQGTVNADAEAKPREVAAVDQTSQTVVEAAPVPSGSYVIQIASLPSEAEAQSSYSKLSAKFGGIIGGKGVDIRKAEIKNKGTYYRVRIPAGSKQQAQALCAQYKQAGGSCLVSK